MYKYVSYIWMSLAVLFVQIFLVDNINLGASMAIWMRPMLFPIVVLLLPVEWKTIWVLLVAYVIGYIMDVSVGGEGLYVATLLPIALLRPWLLYITTNRNVVAVGQPQQLSSLNTRQLMLYLGVTLLIHHSLFFFLEALSLNNFMQVVMTIILSLALSMLIGWFIVRLFISKVLVR